MHSWWTSQKSPAELISVDFVELNSLNSPVPSFRLLLSPSVASLKHHLVHLLPVFLSFSICLSFTFPQLVCLCTFSGNFHRRSSELSMLLLSGLCRVFTIVFIKGPVNFSPPFTNLEQEAMLSLVSLRQQRTNCSLSLRDDKLFL